MDALGYLHHCKLMLHSEPFKALPATIITGAENNHGAATAPNPYSPNNRHQGAEGPFCGCDVLGCCPQPLRPPATIKSNYPLINLSHILFVTASSSSIARLTVCLHGH